MMPSLLKYFTIVGGLLFAGLIGVNALLEPGGPGLSRVQDTPKVAIRHDPRASLVERLRAEEAAQAAAKQAAEKAQLRVVASAPAVKAEPTAKPVIQAVVPQAPVQTAAVPQPPAQTAATPQPQPAPQPVVQAVAQPAPPVTQPAPPAAEPQPVSSPAALAHATDDEPSRSVRTATQEKLAKKAERAEKARKKRIARERERAPRTRTVQEASASHYQDQIYYGYAPRPTYGPFAYPNGGFGGGWGRAW